jgi:hypothetical protein
MQLLDVPDLCLQALSDLLRQRDGTVRQAFAVPDAKGTTKNPVRISEGF